MGLDKTIYDQPLVSVVMCAYNGLPYIKEAVDCIINQTYKNWELIISDDGSRDGTSQWLRENYSNHPRIKIFFQQQNIGYVANKNFVHQHASGVFITQLDNDDCCPYTRLEKQVSAFQAHPEIKIVACGFSRMDNAGVTYGQVAPKDNLLITSDFEGDYPFWFPSLLVHRSVFDQIGYYDEYFSGALGDDLYWTKKANQVYPIYCLSDVLYHYRENPTSITNQFTNIRKLIMPEILRILLGQMKGGSDLLTARDMDSLKVLEESLVQDNVFMAERYRVWAAKAVDINNNVAARTLLWKSFRKNPFNIDFYKTLFYSFRR